MTTASSRSALISASKELTLMSLQIQDSNLYTQDYWRGVAQGLTTAAQLTNDQAEELPHEA